MDEEKLIALVRQYEFLYDTAHPKYMDGAKKDVAWSEISHTLNQPASACKHKWQSLRDAYRRAINKRKVRVGQQMSKVKKWKFEEEISFLSKYLCERRRVVPHEEDASQNEADDENMSNPDFEGTSDCYKIDKEETEHTQTYSLSNDSAIFASTSSSIPGTNIQKNPQKWATSQPSPIYMTTAYTEDIPSKEHKENEVTHDQMDLFFLNISNTVKGFSPYLQAIAKNKIFNLVSELEIQQLTPAKSNVTLPQTSVISQTANWPVQPEQNASHVYVKVEKATGIL